MEIILILLGVAIIPLILVSFLPKDKSFFEKSLVKGFGMGIYMMLVLVLVLEGIEEVGWNSGIMYFVVGLALSYLIGKSLKEFHHHHSNGEARHNHSKASAARILISDFFHNAVDGTAIIAGFSISPAVGSIAFLGVLGHQILQQIGQHILLVESGIQAKTSILVSLVVSLSVFLGFLVTDGGMAGALLALSAGIVAWKVWADLIQANWDKKMITGFMSGALILALILLSIPHAHHEDEEHHEEEELH